jgi:hypothetical protein
MAPAPQGNRERPEHDTLSGNQTCNEWLLLRREAEMRFVRNTFLWLVGIPLPIILLIALFLHPA